MTDANSIIRAVNRAEEVHFLLSSMARIQRRGEQLGIQGGSTHGSLMNLDLLDQAESLRASIVGWSQIVNEEQGDPLPRDDIPLFALYLRERALWITGAPWAEDMAWELQDRTTQGIATLGLFPRRTRLPDDCQCGAPQWVYHEDIGWTLCGAGHVASIAEAIPITTARTFSCAEVALLLDVTRRTVERWVENREIAVASTEPTRISAIAVKAKRVGLAGRSRVA